MIWNTNFAAYHNQDNSAAALAYQTSGDLAGSTNSQQITWGNTPNSDASMSGEMHLFNPASTTYVKNWYSTCNDVNGDATPYQANAFMAGYVNTASAITEVQFKCPSGNFDGIIKMYGIKWVWIVTSKTQLME